MNIETIPTLIPPRMRVFVAAFLFLALASLSSVSADSHNHHSFCPAPSAGRASTLLDDCSGNNDNRLYFWRKSAVRLEKMQSSNDLFPEIQHVNRLRGGSGKESAPMPNKGSGQKDKVGAAAAKPQDKKEGKKEGKKKGGAKKK
eukprot:2689435-Rhodomonas_salina.7